MTISREFKEEVLFFYEIVVFLHEKHWIKTGVEFVDGVYNFSTVVTNDFSSWNVTPTIPYGLRL